MNSIKPLLALAIACVLLYSACLDERTAAQESSSGRTSTVLPMLEVLRKEVLNTVLLDRPVHFTTPQATDTVAQAEPIGSRRKNQRACSWLL